MSDLLEDHAVAEAVFCPIDVFDVDVIRDDFPILRRRIHGKHLVYLDNAATTQKPQVVIDAVQEYYEQQNANIHRGVHYLSELATHLYEETRQKIRQFINAGSDKEIVFTRGTTESINLIASSYGKAKMGPGDEIIISTMEHHSNIVPWQLLCEQVGAKLRVIPIDNDGDLVLEEYYKLLSEKTKLVSIVHISNTLGTINPIKEVISAAHKHDVPVVVDAAQSMAHLRVDVRELDCDFLAFSGHKMLGPTGIGVLYGKEALLNAMPPYQGGGDMILSVSFEKTTFNELPHKFEAGTPNIAATIGLGKAIDYLLRVGHEKIAVHEDNLLEYANEALAAIPEVRVIGQARQKTSVISFVVDGVHPHDIGTILDQNGVAVRTGHHCTQPLMQRFNVPATTRASFALYNTREEINHFIEAIYGVIRLFK